MVRVSFNLGSKSIPELLRSAVVSTLAVVSALLRPQTASIRPAEPRAASAPEIAVHSRWLLVPAPACNTAPNAPAIQHAAKDPHAQHAAGDSRPGRHPRQVYR